MIRGEIWWVDFGIPYGSEPGYSRPAVVIQENSFNSSNINTTVVIPLTTNLSMCEYPCNVFLSAEETRLSKDSVVLAPQIGVVDKIRLQERVSKLSKEKMKEISSSIIKLLNLGD